MLICFPWKGSGGGVVYGCGVWRVKSWVKNVLNTNKYIAISPIKWGWSPLTYLPLVVIIFEKSIILFYWTPYRGIDTISSECSASSKNSYWTPYRGIDTYSALHLPYWSATIEPLIGGLIRYFRVFAKFAFDYWTPYRGIETIIWHLPFANFILLNPL